MLKFSTIKSMKTIIILGIASFWSFNLIARGNSTVWRHKSACKTTLSLDLIRNGVET